MTNSTDVSDMKMTRFGYRVDLIRERHVGVKDEAKIASRGTDWDDIIAEREVFVRSENLRRCCFVPMRRNSVFDGLRSSLFKFIHERMSVKVVVSVSRDGAEFVGVKEMYRWVSSAYKWYLREFLRSTSQEELYRE